MTYRELKAILDNMTEDQLDQDNVIVLRGDTPFPEVKIDMLNDVKAEETTQEWKRAAIEMLCLKADLKM